MEGSAAPSNDESNAQLNGLFEDIRDFCQTISQTPNGILPLHTGAIGDAPSPVSVASPMSVAAAASPASTTMGDLPTLSLSEGDFGHPHLVVVEQPVERCRFRYKAEQGSHGSLRGANSKKRSCPRVKINNWRGNARIMAELYTNEEQPRRHVNELWGATCEGGSCSADVDNTGTALFANLGIMRQKEKDVAEALAEKYLRDHANAGYPITEELREAVKEKAAREQATMKDCLHSVRIGFHAVFNDPASGQQMATAVALSEPIYNSQNPGFTELRIAELDKTHGTCLGGDTIWLRCASKIRRDHVKVRFVEPSSGWESEGTFSPTEVYEQILIIFKTPAYRDTNIRERTHVNLHLFRTTDNEYSPPIQFVYLPVEDQPLAKRPRLIPTMGPDGPGFYFNPSASNPYSTNAGGSKPAPALDYMPSGGEANEYRLHAAPEQRVEQVAPPMERLSLNDMKELFHGGGEGGSKLQTVMSEQWLRHLTALWQFSGDGDPAALVAVARNLIACPDNFGNTALHVAARSGQASALRTLLAALEGVGERASVVNASNGRRQTALQLATRFSDADAVHYLISAGAERTPLDVDGSSTAHYLADTFNDAIYKDVLFPPAHTVAAKQNLPLDALNDAGFAPLHLAVRRLKLSLVSDLLEAGAPVDTTERNSGKTALHLAVETGDDDTMQALIAAGADVHAKTADGATALHLAVSKRHEPIIVRLLEAGADPDAATCSRATEDCDEEADEVIGGESASLCSPRDLAGDSERLCRLLAGERLQPLFVGGAEAAAAAPTSTALGRRRRSSSPLEAAGGAAAVAAARDAGDEFERATAPYSASAMEDDLSSLDFLARLRLSKALDRADECWKRLASALGCEHMVEFIDVCKTADETVSQTQLLLDQYEHVDGATKTRLVDALRQIGCAEAAEAVSRGKAASPPNSNLPNLFGTSASAREGSVP